MSFEGWYQVLCKNGHDMGGHDPYGRKWGTCKHCGAEVAWTNLVDTTNGSYCVTQVYDEDGWPEDVYCTGCEYCDNGRIDRFVELEVRVPAVFCKCGSCGHRHIIEPPRYHIPG